jgi:ribose 5-phosphate isomerase A
VPAALLSALAKGRTIKAGEWRKVSSKDQKYLAAARSLEFVEPGMVLGLGTGSTAAIMVELLGERVSQGFWVSGIPTSEATAELARRCGIPLTDFDQVERVDLTIDGADETDGELRLIKGGGGALLVEVVPFAAPALLPRLAGLGCEAVLRVGRDGRPFVSDEGNLIIDCHFGAIAEPEDLARELNAIPGVVEHGLFLGMAERVLLGGATGVEELVRSGSQ